MLRKITIKIIVAYGVLSFVGFNFNFVQAQTESTSDYIVAQPVSDRTVLFDIDASGDSFSTFKFGYDTAWDWDRNVIRAFRFMESDYIDVIRVSYQPEQDDLVNGDLAPSQITKLNWRLSLVNDYAGPGKEIVMNVAAENVNTGPYYKNPQKWSDLVKATATRIQSPAGGGHTVVSVGPMNEPDYSTHQGDINDFYDIVEAMRQDPFFDNIRISAGNTLNCDPNPAHVWYETMIPAGANEGNTHQLAGGFDGYAGFYELVTGNGHFGTNDEMHNIMEAIVAQQYGAEMGIWWGPAEFARGELERSMNHARIGYAEHRPNWTAAAVYQVGQNNAKAFGGTSERQARPTTYNYVSKDRAVYFDGEGPLRSFAVAMPGDPQGDYWDEQTNAERVVNVTWGEDVQPNLVGRFVIVNRNSGKVLEAAGGSSNNGTNVQQNTYVQDRIYQQWDVVRVDSRIGGDFSYYRIQPAYNSAKSIDLNNFSLSNGENLHLWDNGNGGNQQWYMEYLGDGWFNIRSRESAYCVDVLSASTADGANVGQWEFQGNLNQQWRFLPVSVNTIEFVSPNAPTDLVATANAVSVGLSWTASASTDVAGYAILRKETSGGSYNTIARNVTGTTFIDNTVLSGVAYTYKLKAVDGSLNRSGDSNESSSVTPTGEDTVVCQYKFEDTTQDSSSNLNHAASFGTVSYTSGQDAGKAISLSNNFLQLPSDIANHQEITVAAWVYWNGGSDWQRIFDFGNGDTAYMYLTPRSGTGQLRFGIKNGGSEIGLNAPALQANKWSHVAITHSNLSTKLYVDGKQVAESNSIAISPLDFKPVVNYIGRSQFQDPLFNGRIDDFRVYNYIIPFEELVKLVIKSDNFSVEVIGETCLNKDNGIINIEGNLDLTYNATVNGTSYPFTNGALSVTDLAPATYDICVGISGTNIQQCYLVDIPEGTELSGKTTASKNKLSVDVQSGTAPYKVFVNGISQFETYNTNFDVSLNAGDLLEVKTAKDCEGTISEKLAFGDFVTAIPNPTAGEFDVYLSAKMDFVTIEIYSPYANLISKSNYSVENGMVHLNLENQPAGLYLVRVHTDPVETIRIIKK